MNVFPEIQLITLQQSCNTATPQDTPAGHFRVTANPPFYVRMGADTF